MSDNRQTALKKLISETAQKIEAIERCNAPKKDIEEEVIGKLADALVKGFDILQGKTEL